MPFTIDSDCGTVTYHFIWRHDVPVLLKTVRREEEEPRFGHYSELGAA